MHEAGRAGAAAPFWRRTVALLYETLLLVAVLWAVGFLYTAFEQFLAAPHHRTLFQLYLLVIAGVYFCTQWVRGGQTLAMKTWRLRLVDAAGGGGISVTRGCGRYLLACLSAAAFGAGFLWALVDREGQFLHDRLIGTRIVELPRLSDDQRRS